MMQVIGLCRFSYPAVGGFQVMHDTIEDRRRFLYDPVRLEQRFHLFETLTLPCLRHQTDERFQFLIVVGECLPEPALHRLRDITRDLPQVQIIPKPPKRHRKVMQDVLNAARKDPDQPCLQFRHDDDDAIAIDFVQRLRVAAQDCGGTLKLHDTVGIDFNSGYLLHSGDAGVFTAQIHRPLVTAGLGMYVAAGNPKSIMNFTHNKISRVMPVVTLPDSPMWVRALHAHNDSPQARKNLNDLTPVRPADEQILHQRFAIDPDALRQVQSSD